MSVGSRQGGLLAPVDFEVSLQYGSGRRCGTVDRRVAIALIVALFVWLKNRVEA